MLRFSRVLAGAGLLAAVASCAASSIPDDDDDSTAACIGPHCGEASDAGTGQYTANVGVPDSEPSREAEVTANLLCGVGCDPDDRWAHDCLEADGGLSEAGGSDSTPAVGGDAAAAPPPDALPALGCYVRRGEDGPVAACGPAGIGLAGDLCVTSADCAPGYGCVGEERSAAVCRRFCCEGLDSCEQDGTYCAERMLREEDPPPSSAALMVPVCVVGDNCSLSEPYPCPSEDSCKCPDNTACTVVRADGTTACVLVPPEAGKAGQPCPCAAGHICSESTQTCLRLCQTDSGSPECGQGHCQWNSALPAGYGVCTIEGLDRR